MSLGITELELTDASTISIPTDAILILSLLIIFALLGYCFHNILNFYTSQFTKKADHNSNLELVKEKVDDELILKSTNVNQERLEKTSSKKQSLLAPSKLLGVSSMAVIAIGGASLLGIQAIQNSYKEVKTSQVNIKIKNKSAKTTLSIAKSNLLDKAETKIKKIGFVNPLLSAMYKSKNNSFYQFKTSKPDDFFSF